MANKETSEWAKFLKKVVRGRLFLDKIAFCILLAKIHSTRLLIFDEILPTGSLFCLLRKSLTNLHLFCIYLSCVVLFVEYKEAFAKFNRYRINSLRVKYDYHSIMHYGMKAFSKNGSPTIMPKKPGIFSLGNDQLSPLDIKQTNLLYKCKGKTTP